MGTKKLGSWAGLFALVGFSDQRLPSPKSRPTGPRYTARTLCTVRVDSGVYYLWKLR